MPIRPDPDPQHYIICLFCVEAEEQCGILAGSDGEVCRYSGLSSGKSAGNLHRKEHRMLLVMEE
jgi:hypothetical protein